MKVGLALGGGGARGLAHKIYIGVYIGVIEVLESAGVPIHYISGISIGGDDWCSLCTAQRYYKTKRVSKRDIRVGGRELPNLFSNLISFVKEKYLYAKAFVSPYLLMKLI